MKKIVLFLSVIMLCINGFAQQYLKVHQGNNVLFEKNISSIDSIKFNAANTIFNYGNDFESFNFDEIDSLTFGATADTTISDAIVRIIYNENAVTVINPLENQGVDVQTSGADVTVTSTAGLNDIEYHLSGSTTDGFLSISSDKRFTISLNNVSITNPDGPAIESTVNQTVSVKLADGTTNVLTDGSGSSKKGALQSKGLLIIKGTGSLAVTGVKKNGVHSNNGIKINSGNIQIVSAASDGVHCEYFTMNDGMLTVSSAGGDAIDASEGQIQINGGSIDITLATDDTKGMKTDANIDIDGGSILMNITGNQCKGIKSGMNTTINNGLINITASGSLVMEESGSGYDPSYCTPIKTDADLYINGGIITLNCTNTNLGGKGISVDSTLIINDGEITITTAGNGNTYTNSEGATDSYTGACIKGDGDVYIYGGTINCSSSGTGGKGINVEGTLTIGQAGADNDLLHLTVTTSGARFLVSGSSSGGGQPGGGPGGGPDDQNDYANPKAIKSMGNLTINSGVIVVTTTQTTEGGEGIESKNVLTINGGDLTITCVGDDAMNAANCINFNGGTIYCESTSNDGVDSNGSLNMTGGMLVSKGSRAPESGLDADNHPISITGGVIVATGGDASTNFTGGQKVVKYTGAGNRAIQIVNSSNEVILTYQLPAVSGGGGNPGGGPGGGGGPGSSTNLIMIFTDPQLTTGSYTLKYGGTITGGTNYHGYYTGATYSGGSTKTFTISSSQMTSVTVN